MQEIETSVGQKFSGLFSGCQTKTLLRGILGTLESLSSHSWIHIFVGMCISLGGSPIPLGRCSVVLCPPKVKTTGTVGIERALLLIAMAVPPLKNIYIFSPKDCVLLLKSWSFLSWHLEPPNFVYGMVMIEKATWDHRVECSSNLPKAIMWGGFKLGIE